MKHPGFKNVAKSISKKSGVSAERAGAILGAATRKASASARRKNPHLNRVKGGKHTHHPGYDGHNSIGHY